MNTKLFRQKLNRVGIIVATIISIGVLGHVAVGQISQPAYADGGWCPNNSMDLKNPTSACIDSVYNSIPNNLKSNLSESQFVGLATNCQSSSGGVGVHEGACVNAVSYCYQHSNSVSDCATPAYLKAIASSCNDGEGTSGSVCPSLQTANNQNIQKAYDQTIATASSTCTTTNGNQAAQKSACLQGVCTSLGSGNTIAPGDCKSSACPVPSSYSSDPYATSSDTSGQTATSDLTGFQTCLNNALKNSSTDQAECTTRGGAWTNADTGTGGNKVLKGCHANYTDLTNQQACTSAQPPGTFEITQGANTPTPSDDVYTCVAPSGTPANPNGTSTPQGVDTPSGHIDNSSPNQCGQAMTNLISCSKDPKDRGVPVLASVLKIAIEVLTALIGIASVFGIAWEALNYAKAQDDSSEVSKAKNRIQDIIIGLVVYALMIVIINWLVPGGVIG